jgi:hypothetical protein
MKLCIEGDIYFIPKFHILETGTVKLSIETNLISCRRTDTVIPTVPPPDKLCGSQAPPIVEEDEEMERSSVQRCGPRPELRRAASRRPRASPELSMWIWRGERRLSGEAFLYAS